MVKEGWRQKEQSNPVLTHDYHSSDKEKLMANTCVEVHSSNYLSEKEKNGRDRTKAEYREVICRKYNFSGDEKEDSLKMVLDKTGHIATGKD